MKEQIKKHVSTLVRKRATMIAALVIVFYTLAGFLLLPFLIGHYGPGILGDRLDSDVTIGNVSFNPYSLTLEVEEFRISEPSGEPLANVRHLHANFQISSLFRRALTLKDAIIDQPSLNIVIDEDGNLNLSRLAGSAQEEQPSEAGGEQTDKEEHPFRMLLYNAAINGARIDITDNRQVTPAKASLHPLTIQFTDISTIPDREGNYSLTATGSEGAVFNWTGDLTIHPFRSEGELAFRNISAETPWAFYRSMLNLLPPGGTVSVETHYRIIIGADETVTALDDLFVRVTGFGMQLEDTREPFIRLPAVALDAETIDVANRRIHGLSLVIDGGNLDVISNADGILNLRQVMASQNEAPAPSEPEAVSDLPDLPDPSDPTDSASPWNIDIAGVSLEDFSLLFRDEAQSPARLASAKGISLTFNAAVTAPAPRPEIHLDDLGLVLRGIEAGFADADRPTLQIGTVSATGGTFDLAGRSASLSHLGANDGAIDVIRYDDTSLNLEKLFDRAGVVENRSENASPENGEPWNIFLETLELTGFSAHVSDETVQPEETVVDMEDINLTLSRFDAVTPFPFEASLQIRQGGGLEASGTIDPSGVWVESAIAVEDLAFPLIQPYLAQAADLTLSSGKLSSVGTFALENEKITYQGQASIADMDVVENRTQETIIGWTRLKTPELRFGLNPNGVHMDSLNLHGLRGELIIAEDGSLNVVEAFRTGDDKPAPAAAETAPDKPDSQDDPFPVSIDRVVLDEGTLRFADFSLTPQFDTVIHELKGTITGVSSAKGARSTRVDMDGRVDRYGTSTIEGEINVFDPKDFTDISMIFRNLEMSNLTPYSGRFAGREIDSGRLSLDLKYLVEDNRLQSQNQVIIESLVLGERVESPDAVDLPLGLAIALLRDSDGVIDIELPVTGSLDDPEFSLGQVIWQSFVNLITRMVSSPFRALGALFGAEDETLNQVLVEPGSVDILPTEEEKLDTLIKALHQRPQLKLIVTGRYDTDADGRALRDLQVRRAYAEASGIGPEPGSDPGPVDFDTKAAQEILKDLFLERYGENQYEQVIAGKDFSPENENKEPEESKITPSEEARRLFDALVEYEPVGQQRLTALADERARFVVARMTGPDGLNPQRVTTAPPTPVEDGDTLSVLLDLDSLTGE